MSSLSDRKRAREADRAERYAAEAHRVCAYAHAVARGECVAGPEVRAAAHRHIRDMERASEDGAPLRWNPQRAGRAMCFFPDRLQVKDPRTQALAPFDLLDWQAFIVGSLFGWEAIGESFDGVDWSTRYSEAYVETGKGTGKSPLAAGVAIYKTVAEGASAPETYFFAAHKEQAQVAFRDCVSMVRNSQKLSGGPRPMLRILGSAQPHQILFQQREGFIKPIASDTAQSGPRPRCAISDEYHEQRTSELRELMKRGFKGTSDPLLFTITNTGSEYHTPCGKLHRYAKQVVHGEVERDDLFVYICSLDDEDIDEDRNWPFEKPECWPKVNPSIGAVVPMAYIRSAIRDAEGIPSERARVMRLNFCQWEQAEAAWISRKLWSSCERDIRLEDMRGKRCYAGLDLSFSQDLSAMALVFPEDGRYRLFVEFWKPGDLIAEHSRRDGFDYAVDAPYLHMPPGKVLKIGGFAERLGEVAEAFDLQCVAYDNLRVPALLADLAERGLGDLPMMVHPQGFKRTSASELWMPTSTEAFENAALEELLDIRRDPLLRWNVVNTVVVTDRFGNKMLDKDRSLGRIDGAVASAMAMGAAAREVAPAAPATSYLETQELVAL